MEQIPDRDRLRLKTDLGGVRAMIGQLKRNEWPTPSNLRDSLETYIILAEAKLPLISPIRRRLPAFKEMLVAIHERKCPLPAHLEAASAIVEVLTHEFRSQSASQVPSFVHSPLCSCLACQRGSY